MAYRNVLIGILTGLDENNEPDVEEVMCSFLDELRDANPFDVALAAFEIITRLAAELSTTTGQSRAETLRIIAASIANHPAP
jgi:hypothetical protein